MLKALQREVADLLQRNNTSFPGAQPVSFARKHIRELHTRDYYLCEKTDGIRCLLYLSMDSNDCECAYLIDRKNDFYYQPDAHFPRMGDPTFQKFHDRTLLDGELVVDTLETPDGPEQRLRYLVFDLIVLDSDVILGRPLNTRLGKLNAFVSEPYREWIRSKRNILSTQPFELLMKKMEFSYALSSMFRDKLRRLAHGNDGVIFTCQETPYNMGTDEHILKWKPPHENTIDFRLSVGDFPLFDPEDGGEGLIPDYDAKPGLELLVNHGRGEHRVYAQLFVADDEWESMKALNEVIDGRIIECYCDDKGRWRYKREPSGAPRFRDDKHDANHISTVNKVLESIEDGVTEEQLIAAEMSIREAWKQRAGQSSSGAVKRAPDRDISDGVKRVKTDH